MKFGDVGETTKKLLDRMTAVRGGRGFESLHLHMKGNELYWLAGILEGEGSFCAGPPSKPNQPRIAVTSTDRDVIMKVHGLIGGTITQNKKRKPHHKDSWQLLMRGTKAVALMKVLKPLMSKRRRGQIEHAIS